MWTDVPREFNVLAKSGANPISPEEILAKIRSMADSAANSSPPGNRVSSGLVAALVSGRPMD
jgi:hypothetical protein